MTGISMEKSITFEAPAEKVWDALTNPEKIRQYLYGTEAVSDWKVGSSLLFRGVWEGKEYLDKGIILEFEPNRILKYSYLSSFSGLEDEEKNYQILTFKLIPKNGGTVLTLKQENIQTEEAKQHSDENWGSVLNAMRSLME